MVSAAVIVASSSNTSLGWIMIGVFLAVFIIVVGITRYVSLGSLIVVWYFPLYVILEYHGIETSLFVIMLFIALLFTALAYFRSRKLGNRTCYFVCKQWTSGYDLVKGESRDRYAQRA